MKNILGKIKIVFLYIFIKIYFYIFDSKIMKNDKFGLTYYVWKDTRPIDTFLNKIRTDDTTVILVIKEIIKNDLIKNQKNTLYTGISKDIDRRINLHNSGKGAKFTRGRGLWQLTYSEGPFEHGDALRREMEIKRDKALKRRLKSYNG